MDAWIDAQIVQTQKAIAVCDKKGARPMKEPASDLALIRADALQAMELEPIKFIVDDMIVSGLTIIASEPKFGKSWLMLQLCIAVTSEQSFLGHKTHPCGALYLALEDSYNRLQSRLKLVLDGENAPHNLSMTIRSADLGDGLLEQLDSFLQKNPDTGLIVIDTFQRIRPASGRIESMYAADYREVGELKHFADDHKIAMLLVHHTRKMKDPSDAFMNISGSMGITGAADTMIVLSKVQRNDDTTKMSIIGRDVEMQEYEMEFQKNCRWHILGSEDEIVKKRAREKYDQNPVVLTVKKLLDQNGGIWTGSASELISSSRYFGAPIHETALALGKSISKVADVMFQYDRIIYQAIKNGNAARKHRFQYQVLPEYESADTDDSGINSTVETVEFVDNLEDRWNAVNGHQRSSMVSTVINRREK